MPGIQGHRDFPNNASHHIPVSFDAQETKSTSVDAWRVASDRDPDRKKASHMRGVYAMPRTDWPDSEVS